MKLIIARDMNNASWLMSQQATADQQLAVQRTGAQGTATTGTTVVHQTTPSMTVTSVTQPVQTAVVSSTVLVSFKQKLYSEKSLLLFVWQLKTNYLFEYIYTL